jgi:large subunit ribosomal protein L13
LHRPDCWAYRPGVHCSAAEASDIQRAWHVVDAEDAVLGRMASEIAVLLRGKHKPIWAPNVDAGDHVVVVNADKLDVSARKAVAKQYYRHSGYPGGLSQQSLERMLERHPERVVHLAVKGMLPKGRLGRSMIKKLRVYTGPNHPHTAQQPEPYALIRRGGR